MFYELAALGVAGISGVVLAWFMRRGSTLSIRNLYMPATIGLGATLCFLASGRIALAAILAPLCAATVTAQSGGAAVAASRPRRRRGTAPA